MSQPLPPLVAVVNDRELRLQPLWPASTSKPFWPWVVSSARLLTCTGKGFELATVVSTSADAPG